MTTRNGVKKV